MLALTLLAILVLGSFFGQRAIIVPSFFGGGSSGVLASTFLPLAWAAAVADGFGARCQSVEARPSGSLPGLSRLGIFDASLFSAVVAIAAISYSIVVVVSGSALAGTGPMLVLSGVSCVATLRAGPAAGALAASALLIVTTVYGAAAPAAQYVRILQPDGDPLWSLACGLVVCAVACWLLLTDRVATQLSATERLD